MIYRFADAELDTKLVELSRGGETRKLGPRVYAFLLHLLENRDRVVPKQELLDVVWPGTSISEAALQQCAAQVRRALGQRRGAEPIVEAVYGQGYRIVAEVTVLHDEPVAAPAGGSGRAGSPQHVGRGAELSSLDAALAQLEAGRGGIVLVCGAAGIGKTHVLSELRARAERRGLRVRHGRCPEQDGVPPYWPFAQALRDELADRGANPRARASDELLAELAPILPELAERGDVALAGPTSRSGSRERLFESVSEFMTLAAKARPAVLLLDDVHRADPESLQLLAHLAPELEKLGWLVVAAHRPAPEGSPAAAVALASCARAASAERLELEPLTPAEVAQFLGAVTGREPSAGVAARLHERSGGNPFLLNQLVPFLDPERHTLGFTPALDRLPGSVREAVARQTTGLSAGTREVLAHAAVLGRDAEVAVLADLCGLSREALDGALFEARAVGLLSDSPYGAGFVRFVHALVAEVLYAALPQRHAARLHTRAADSLEAGERAPGPWLSEAARHRLAALPHAPLESAVSAALRAADWSAERLAFEAAAQLYDRVLALLEGQPGKSERLLALRLRAADLWRDAGDAERGFLLSLQAGESARQLGDANALARAALGYGVFREQGERLAVLNRLLDDALLALVDRSDEQARGLRARLLARSAIQLSHTPDPTVMGARTREAREEARSLAEVGALGHALIASAAVPLLDELRDAPGWAAEAVAIGERTGEAELVYMGLHFGAQGHFRLGEFEAAWALWDRAAELGEELRTPLARYYPALVKGMRDLFQGRTLELYGTFMLAREIGRRALPFGSEILFSAQGLQAHVWMGGVPEGFATVAQALVARFPETIAYRQSLATILLALEHDERLADQVAQIAPPLLARAPLDPIQLSAICELGEMLVRLGERDHGARAYELLSPWSELVEAGNWGATGGNPVALSLSKLATLIGRADAAVEHAERAIELGKRGGSPPIRAMARLALASALHAEGSPAARGRAQVELDAGLDELSRVGLAPTRRAARELEARLAQP